MYHGTSDQKWHLKSCILFHSIVVDFYKSGSKLFESQELICSKTNTLTQLIVLYRPALILFLQIGQSFLEAWRIDRPGTLKRPASPIDWVSRSRKYSRYKLKSIIINYRFPEGITCISSNTNMVRLNNKWWPVVSIRLSKTECNIFPKQSKGPVLINPVSTGD